MTTFLLLLSTLFLTSYSKTAEEWRTRTIYQILTDRFARSDGTTPECPDLLNYCGGTFKGIENNLDYIQGMGFDAIWISPVMENGEGGYHGYWSSNFYEINPHFGTKQDFHDLVTACHERDIWVMVDTVPNHVSPVPTYENGTHDFSGIYPFNDASHYHFPILPCKEVFDHDPDNQTALQFCWLWKLPDLNHENPYVEQTLLDWVKDFVETYDIDGLRVDAVKHVPLWFWSKFSKASGVFTIGEVWHHDVQYVGSFQNYMDSLLNYPLYGILAQVFTDGQSMSRLNKYHESAAIGWKDKTVLGNFVDNHDLSRYLSHTPDMATYKVFYAYVLATVGIPMVYYGDEQCFNGGDDPENREPLWGKMNTDSEMYQFFKTIIEFKKKSGYHNYEQIERFSDESLYAFSRGENFFAFTNTEEMQTRTISNHPYEEGGYLCDIFNQKDCVQVRNGEFQITLIGKQAKFLAPQPNPETETLRNRAWKNLKKIWSNLFTSDASKMATISNSGLKR